MQRISASALIRTVPRIALAAVTPVRPVRPISLIAASSTTAAFRTSPTARTRFGKQEKRMVHNVATADEFKQFVDSGKVVVVDFFATWCGPCRVIAPKVDALSKVYSNAVFLKLDVDEVPTVSEAQGIRAMPTFQIFKDGKQVAEVVGADPNKLEAAIKKFV